MRRLVSNDTPIGVLAYKDDDPVGWCSIAPPETYAKLEFFGILADSAYYCLRAALVMKGGDVVAPK